MIRSCGILVDPETGSGYDRLPVSPELRTLIRDVHRNAGDPRFEMRYNPDGPTRYEQRSLSSSSTSSFYRPPGDLANERLRLKLALLQRMRG
jgi:hypothetical protein